MALTSGERSRTFKEKMYAKGYKQVQVWVLRNPSTKGWKTDRNGFIRKLDELTAGWSKKMLAELYEDLIRIAGRKSKKEAKRKE